MVAMNNPASTPGRSTGPPADWPEEATAWLVEITERCERGEFDHLPVATGEELRRLRNLLNGAS